MENRSARINVEGGEIEFENGNELQRQEEENVNKEEEELCMEKMFENKEVPPWTKQLTTRAFAVSFLLSVVFCFIVMKLTFTVGIIPSLNTSAGLLGFIFIKTWTKAIKKYSGMLGHPFTRQENTVIQTCVVASTSIAFSGGFGSYLFAMSERVEKQSEQDNYSNYKNPALAWMIGFLFVTSFLGPFIVVPISKIMISDFRLTYPSGTATAHMINSFHSNKGAKLSKKNFKVLRQFLSFSFVWSFFQWFFTGGDDCGFSSFPIFGLKAYQNRFYFDLSATFVGIGMLTPCIINASVLVGGILSWGIMWPLIKTRKGDWYAVDLKPSSLHGLQGYKVFIGTAMILGDGLYNLLKVLCQTVARLSVKLQERKTNMHIPVTERFPSLSKSLNYDDQCRNHVFLKDQIPTWFAIGGYIAIAAVSTVTLPHVFRQLNWYYMIVEPATLPHIFHQLKWYYIIAIYVLAPILAFSNACGSGQTDWSLASHYGKLAIFTIGAWAGASRGGILAGLSACGVVMNIVTTASDLVQDFKTGYLTLASPRSMFVSQIIGTAMGCIISPCVFWIFYKAFQDFGLPTSEYPVPYATTYYEIAKLGVKGFSSLPKECLKLCYSFFATSILINLIRDGLGEKRSWFIPVPTAMAIPFYIGPYFAIDMCIGNLILFIWQKKNKTQANASGQLVASGLICGDGIWTLVGSILALAGVKPPICMKFLSRATNSAVDKFLES